VAWKATNVHRPESCKKVTHIPRRRVCVIFLQALPEGMGGIGSWELGIVSRGGVGVDGSDAGTGYEG
jgi:hypothetical protein